MRPGKHLDRLGLRIVGGDWVMVVPVGGHHIGQQLGIRKLGLGCSRDVVAVAGRSQRVNGEHLISGCSQGVHPEPAIGWIGRGEGQVPGCGLRGRCVILRGGGSDGQGRGRVLLFCRGVVDELRELREQNARLKRPLADAELEKDAPREVAKGKF